jgi:hypothetical protein
MGNKNGSRLLLKKRFPTLAALWVLPLFPVQAEAKKQLNGHFWYRSGDILVVVTDSKVNSLSWGLSVGLSIDPSRPTAVLAAAAAITAALEETHPKADVVSALTTSDATVFTINGISPDEVSASLSSLDLKPLATKYSAAVRQRYQNHQLRPISQTSAYALRPDSPSATALKNLALPPTEDAFNDAVTAFKTAPVQYIDFQSTQYEDTKRRIENALPIDDRFRQPRSTADFPPAQRVRNSREPSMTLLWPIAVPEMRRTYSVSTLGFSPSLLLCRPVCQLRSGRET